MSAIGRNRSAAASPKKKTKKKKKRKLLVGKHIQTIVNTNIYLLARTPMQVYMDHRKGGARNKVSGIFLF